MHVHVHSHFCPEAFHHSSPCVPFASPRDLPVLRRELGAGRHPVAQAAAVGATSDAADLGELLHQYVRVVHRHQYRRDALLGLLKDALQIEKR